MVRRVADERSSLLQALLTAFTAAGQTQCEVEARFGIRAQTGRFTPGIDKKQFEFIQTVMNQLPDYHASSSEDTTYIARSTEGCEPFTMQLKFSSEDKGNVRYICKPHTSEVYASNTKHATTSSIVPTALGYDVRIAVSSEIRCAIFSP